MRNPLRVFIGYDEHESSAFHVLSHSIHRYASEPVSVTPVKLSELEGTYARPRGAKESTAFSMSRFLVPYLCDFQDWALFMDCDMLVRTDIAALFDLKDESKAVQVVKHDYTPSTEHKMLGQKQTTYPKKNWSSLMLMNTKRCWQLHPGYVNTASGLELHQFKWLESDDLIGGLPLEWNWLAGEYEHNDLAAIVHYTLGGPWWDDYVCCDYAEDWHEMLEHLLNEMGDQSQHAASDVRYAARGLRAG